MKFFLGINTMDNDTKASCHTKKMTEIKKLF
ncbi:Uncharacterised protein [Enterobacter hormaechei]|nr:hypothetical protein HMPREF9689_04043 [Klebsiella oxytoca 10-5245]CAE7409437.1 hypothetical protein AI2659V1_3626 [Enterobacter cloacae]CZV42477.1 Uncharacterised protein [Enterobacter hormaechei]SAP93492.1 Uncharacterised protein [Klebsiella oxytoca]SAU91338.1 Uncharacterised protein [Klebsiella pneumoniae]SBL58175.1 Uncharacterised protein [Klebsiella michiganensis]